MTGSLRNMIDSILSEKDAKQGLHVAAKTIHIFNQSIDLLSQPDDKPNYELLKKNINAILAAEVKKKKGGENAAFLLLIKLRKNRPLDLRIDYQAKMGYFCLTFLFIMETTKFQIVIDSFFFINNNDSFKSFSSESNIDLQILVAAAKCGNAIPNASTTSQPSYPASSKPPHTPFQLI